MNKGERVHPRDSTHHHQESTTAMQPTTQRRIAAVATAIPVFLVTLSGIMKLLRAERIVQGFTQLGVVQYLPFLGIAEIAFAALLVSGKTLRWGFLLLSCYFAGAMATELSHGMPPVAPIALLALLWLCAFLRDRTIFLGSTEATHEGTRPA
jgi:hypothetical protein